MVGKRVLSSEGYHQPVLLREALEPLQVKRDEWYLDCTLGDGGHSLEILERGGRIVGLDVDPEALARTRQRFKGKGIPEDRFILIRGNFRDLGELLNRQAETRGLEFKGVVFDLGVSSLQLETPQRGFSFSQLGPLDMRIDPDLGIRADDLINNLSRKELYELFYSLGEEKLAKRVADAVVSARQVAPVTSTRELADLVESVYRKVGIKKGKIHPATKVFQALRIAVNDELVALTTGLAQSLERTKKDGCILVISFHSLEDRITKNTFKKWQSLGFGQMVTKKPITASNSEIDKNPRSRSAKMRVFKKI